MDGPPLIMSDREMLRRYAIGIINIITKAQNMLDSQKLVAIRHLTELVLRELDREGQILKQMPLNFRKG